MLRLNLGAGKDIASHLPGFENIDIAFGGNVYPLLRGTNNAKIPGREGFLGYDDACAEIVRASHVLEHLSHTVTADALAEWCRVLKPGGVLKLAVPNFDWIRLHHDDPMSRLYLLGGHIDEHDKHGAAFTESDLRGLMEEVGLVDIQPWEGSADDCSGLAVSLNLCGVKADPNAPPKPRLKIPKTMAVLSCPRVGFTDTWQCITRNLVTGVGIQVAVGKGVYWGQSLERLFERCVASGVEQILTLDYDSIFTRQDVIDLLRLMHDHTEADAIAPLQVRRSSDEVLAGIMQADGTPTSKLEAGESPLTQVTSAHFGLTLIRVSSLLKLRHPWFYERPNEFGRWEEGRMDSDISFWFKWKDAGNSLYIANKVAIGHIETMVAWPSADGGVIYEHVGQFEEKGKPANVRC